MNEPVMMTCPKCGKTKKEGEFYKKRDGSRFELCKICTTMYVDNRRPETFKWILKEFDVPYVEKEWVKQANKAYMKNPAKFGPMSVIGTYLRTMRMSQYKEFHYDDSDKLNNKQIAEATQEMANLSSLKIDEEYEAKLEEKLKNGEISQAQYNTMSRKSVIDRINEKMRQGEKEIEESKVNEKTELEVPENTVEPKDTLEDEDSKIIQQAKELADKIAAGEVESDAAKQKVEQQKVAQQDDDELTDVPQTSDSPHETVLDLAPNIASSLGVNPMENIDNQLAIGSTDSVNQFIPDVARVDESQISAELTPDDIKYLSLKWGLLYKPSEWVKMEELYQKYAADYELSTDREQVLKNICKTDLKMNQALDVGDVKTFKDLQSSNDMLRKSGKFTDSQKQEEKKRDIDSIGELVSFVESKGGIIPRYDDPINVPQDKIDFIINDMKNYTDNLVKNELGLGDLIESYIKKLEENKTKSVAEIMKEGVKPDEDDVVTPEEAEEFQEFQMREREDEAKRLAEKYGSD